MLPPNAWATPDSASARMPLADATVLGVAGAQIQLVRTADSLAQWLSGPSGSDTTAQLQVVVTIATRADTLTSSLAQLRDTTVVYRFVGTDTAHVTYAIVGRTRAVSHGELAVDGRKRFLDTSAS